MAGAQEESGRVEGGEFGELRGREVDRSCRDMWRIARTLPFILR